jgi:hypothetical protein
VALQRSLILTTAETSPRARCHPDPVAGPHRPRRVDLGNVRVLGLALFEHLCPRDLRRDMGADAQIIAGAVDLARRPAPLILANASGRAASAQCCCQVPSSGDVVSRPGVGTRVAFQFTIV